MPRTITEDYSPTVAQAAQDSAWINNQDDDFRAIPDPPRPRVWFAVVLGRHGQDVDPTTADVVGPYGSEYQAHQGVYHREGKAAVDAFLVLDLPEGATAEDALAAWTEVMESGETLTDARFSFAS